MEGASRETRMPSHERIQQEQMLRRKVLAGDQAAWQTLYDGAFAALWAYASWRCAGWPDLTEEITQETWLAAVRRMRDFDPSRASFATWLRGIAAHVVRNHLRARQRRSEPADLGAIEPISDLPHGGELAELIARVLVELPERYEAVLRAKYLDQASVAQIAAESGESPKAIESVLTRARQAFRSAYEKLAGNDVLLREPEP
jgi:RNA polymerase sigma-70 factor (ECF subfamily)